MFETILIICPILLILGLGGVISKAILRIPVVSRWFTSLFYSLPLGRDEVQNLKRKRR